MAKTTSTLPQSDSSGPGASATPALSRSAFMLSMALLLPAVCSSRASAQEWGAEAQKRALTVAQSSVRSLRKAPAPKRLGFESAEEMDTAMVRDLAICIVQLSQLPGLETKFQDEPMGCERAAFQVTNTSGMHRATIELQQGAAGWEARSFGVDDSIRAAVAAIESHGVHPGSDYYVVRVPSLLLYFLGIREAGGFWFRPLRPYPRFGFTLEAAPLRYSDLQFKLLEARSREIMQGDQVEPALIDKLKQARARLGMPEVKPR